MSLVPAMFALGDEAQCKKCLNAIHEMIANTKALVGEEPRPPMKTLSIVSEDAYERALWGLTTMAKSLFERGPFTTIEEVIAFETELKRDSNTVLKAHRQKRRKKAMQNKKGSTTTSQHSAQKALDAVLSSGDPVGALRNLHHNMMKTYDK